MKIGAVVLAAGGSLRLGQAKQLLTYRGKAFVRLSAEAALDSGCSPVVIVLGQEREKITTELHNLPVELVFNRNWERGIGSSISAAVKAASHCDALIILACDQPYVTSALLNKIIAAHQETEMSMVASAYADTVGVPALFAHRWFEQLLSLGDNQGAKSLLTARLDEVGQVDFPQGAIDIDTSGDYETLQG